MFSSAYGRRVVICLLALVLILPASVHATDPAHWSGIFARTLQGWNVLWSEPLWTPTPSETLESDEPTGEEGPHLDPHGNTQKGHLGELDPTREPWVHEEMRTHPSRPR